MGKLSDRPDPGTIKPECEICGDTGWVRYSAEVESMDFGKIYPCEHRLAEIKEANFQRLEKYSNLSQFKGLKFESCLLYTSDAADE